MARRLISVPVEFLSDEQVAAYGHFAWCAIEDRRVVLPTVHT